MTPFKMLQNTEKESYRASTFWSKEPETIAWIFTFDKDGIFWDVGANIGIYSLYHAFKKNGKAVAFEPFKANYNALCSNISMNGFDENIKAENLALSDTEGVFVFQCDDEDSGASHGELTDEKAEYPYGVKTIMGDSYAQEHGVPRYIKIDVDGREYDVLCGMEEVLKSPDCRGVLVEINRDKVWIEEMLLDNGFVKDEKFNNVRHHSLNTIWKKGGIA